MQGDVAGGRTRRGSALAAAGLTNGPAELLDFLIPLWAGVTLGASPVQVGFLVALELIVSVIARPIAGHLADSIRRELIAGVGALLYGLSCCGYALAGSLPLAYAAAALGGLGGALLWVSVRAMVGEYLPEEPSVFARLMAVQETGVWVAFVAGLLLLGWFDSFEMVFLAGAAACLLAAVVLFLSPARDSQTPRPPSGSQAGGASFEPHTSRGLIASLRPMLVATVVTALAETMIGILLLLHLQRGLGLGIVEIAYVFLPGAVALGVLPPILHRVVEQIGRRAGMVVGSICSGTFAICLAYVSGPVVIAGLWVLCGVAWALVIPIEQAVITEKHPHQTGAAMGIYTAATLIGSAIGALLAGILYQAVFWQLTCLVAGAIIVSGAALGPWAIRALGLADKSAPPTPPSRSTR